VKTTRSKKKRTRRKACKLIQVTQKIFKVEIEEI
jgi:hypothetical protein